MVDEVRLEKQEEALVLTDGKGRQIILTDYGEEIGIWFKFLHQEIKIPKLYFIRHLFKD